MKSEFVNIIWLFKNLPKIGFGNKRVFKGTDECFEYASKVVEGSGSVNLIFHRWAYNESGGKLNINDWYDHIIKTEDNYMTYMLKNYRLVKGVFDINRDDRENIEKLAGILKKYINGKK